MAFPEQLPLLTHGLQMLLLQKPLLQSALTVHVLWLSSKQSPSWHLFAAHSASIAHGAPPGTLHIGAAQTADVHWLSTLQSAHLPAVQRPLPQATLSAQTPPVWTRHRPAKHLLLAQSLSAPHFWLASFLQTPAPLHTCDGALLQVTGSVLPMGTFEQIPTVPAILHAWHVPVQAVSQQRPSSQWVLAQLPLSAQTSPLHFWQSPPQSAPSSWPFLMPSEQLMQVCVTRSHVGVVPTVQSPLTTQAGPPVPVLVAPVVDPDTPTPLDVESPPVPVPVLAPPPEPFPGHFRRSLHSSGANRHPSAQSPRPSAPIPASIHPSRA